MITLKLFANNNIGLGNSTIHPKTYLYIVTIGNFINIWEMGVNMKEWQICGLWKNINKCLLKIHFEVTYHFAILILGFRARQFNGWLPLRFTRLLLTHAANLIASLWRLCRPSPITQRDEGYTANIVRYYGMLSLAQSNSVILSTQLHNQSKSSDQIKWSQINPKFCR